MIVGLKIFQAQLMQVVVWGSNAYLVQADIDMIKQVLIDYNISSILDVGLHCVKSAAYVWHKKIG